jgi:O-acetyl-ADP-ribose deacetylase (regulator of RNase III)
MTDAPHTHRVEVEVADIADVARHGCQAYVNAANNELWMGSGVAGALKRAAGAEVEREAVAQGPIDVGDAVLTSAGRMPPPARVIIHAAAMGFTERTQIYASAESVGRATKRALELCNEHGLSSVVFPALGTGVGGLSDEACASAMVAALVDHWQHASMPERVRFVVTNDDRAAIFRQQVNAQRPGSMDTSDDSC